MILTDAGPLVAILDRDEPDHGACVAALSSLSGPMLTTWPALTEAMYLLGRGGWRIQLDRGHFHTYRLPGRGRFQVIP